MAVSENTVEVGESESWFSSCLKFKQSSAKAGSMYDDTVDERAGKEKETK
jgi:hypothetical protein